MKYETIENHGTERPLQVVRSRGNYHHIGHEPGIQSYLKNNIIFQILILSGKSKYSYLGSRTEGDKGKDRGYTRAGYCLESSTTPCYPTGMRKD